ncbi:SDR family NAD(P)-dependent oxidoreductase [Microbacterium sp. SORGH_AS_0862]|uniref:SDR family NAD(P)-dependent oxidoreductase n=1 Tax=Microbacterium sp. SORGH_AS_0862 TaxID=3041789 RepID=UPI00278D1383|nr:SDR family oxidoreductase [Microbacterium sp. SORGH_AS_0862]MDQ1204813.1 NAD(P)-dependent dehydrogenase (short-subunit alcohol dehydrogenase family) [Microbacterium sp. SORGH_AS_0862]
MIPPTASALTPDKLFDCSGQVAIVTGAASGIGAACAEALAAAGARVVIADLGVSAPDAEAARLRRLGLEATGMVCDVTDDAQLAALVEETMTRFGRIDTVLANAGAALDDPGGSDAVDRLDAMYRLHVRSVSLLADLAVPHLAGAGGGLFLVMSSLAGLRGNRTIGGYGVTKAANAQIVRNLAVSWGGRGVRANAIAPGVIETSFARAIIDDPDVATARLAKTPLARFGRPAEVAAAAVWLASPGGAFVSGQTIVIDGGTLVAD